MPIRAKLDFVFFDAGGGHRSAATALESAIAAGTYPWDVRLVNLQEVLDPLDIFRKITGVRLQDLYNRMLAKGWTLGSNLWLPLMQWVIRRYHRQSVQLLADFWRDGKPDLVVSLIPNLNRALLESLRLTTPTAPFVTILTDMADYPPHFWMERQDQHLVCGTPRAAQQARRQGYPADRIHEVSGMILRPVFYQPRLQDRALERVELGFDSSLATGLVMFGGEGSNVMYQIAERLGNSVTPLQLIFICGRNNDLRERLSRMKTRNRILVLGFTKEVPRYMALADFFVGKPGPGSISEAVHMGLPVIVESNSWTLPQERYNTEWLTEQGFGVVLRNLSQIEPTVRSLLANGKLDELRARVATYKNCALFEIPPILDRILSGCRKEIMPAAQATSVLDSAG